MEYELSAKTEGKLKNKDVLTYQEYKNKIIDYFDLNDEMIDVTIVKESPLKYKIIRYDTNHALINQSIRIETYNVDNTIINEVTLSYDILKKLFNTNPLDFIRKISENINLTKEINDEKDREEKLKKV